jgi:hypothetical protein
LESGGRKAVLKYEPISLDKVYVPIKKRKSLDFAVVRQIAESILEVGQETPILVRPDQSRFVLVEGLHRLEACRALGETTILASIVAARVEPEAPSSPAELRAEAERQKIQRLRQLRLEREAVERMSPSPLSTPAAGTSTGRSTPRRSFPGYQD